MNRVVKILMRRDGITEEEAREIIAEVKEMMESSIGDGCYSEAEEIFQDELGLEPDYIFDIF